jgi:hypothetical protein
MKTLTKNHLYLSIGALAFALCSCSAQDIGLVGQGFAIAGNAITAAKSLYPTGQPKQTDSEQTVSQPTNSEQGNDLQNDEGEDNN